MLCKQKKKRAVLRVGKNDACDGVEEDLEVLEKEYVTLDTGESYKAMSEDDYDYLLSEYEDDEDELEKDYGLIITY